MLKFRYILFPFSLLYACITKIRNFLYDKQIIKSESFDIPVINVGNLSLGGTGKTPMIEYLIRLLQKDYKIAVISRGYKRKSKGFIVADNNSSAEKIGDEPYQIHRKFKDVIVAVGEKRADAIRKVLVKFKPDVILLDDAFQHRSVQAGFNILLTTYQKPFVQDFILPTGDLRECRHNAKRAHTVIVTKSPVSIPEKKKEKLIHDIHKYVKQDVFFAQIKYAGKIFSKQGSIDLEDLKAYQVVLITGIAQPQTLYDYLSEKNLNFEVLKFDDHHHFSKADIQRIKKVFEHKKTDNKLILSTEKDYVRLQNHFEKELYYLPIETEITDNNKFNNKILDYVQK